jgi:monomeric isocitrate dehydrogenase
MKQLEYRGYTIKAYEGRHPSGGSYFTVWTEIFDRSREKGAAAPIKTMSAPNNLNFRKKEAEEYGVNMARKWIDEEIATGNLKRRG